MDPSFLFVVSSIVGLGSSKGDERKTIEDFGDQWTRFTDNSGYYGSKELLGDVLSPFLSLADVDGKNIAEIGSGTGRIVSMLLDAGAGHVTAIEPSRAFYVLASQYTTQQGRVTCRQAPGEVISEMGPFDLIVSIGVLHHIPLPEPVVAAALKALRPGGNFLIWLYGREGNSIYLSFVAPLRALTTRLPDRVLDWVVRLLDIPLVSYIGLCRWLPLPMHTYMRQVLAQLAPDKRRLVIFDQLNPAHAKYYSRTEAIALLKDAGFVDVEIHHRHGYSWTVIGRKPKTRDADNT